MKIGVIAHLKHAIKEPFAGGLEMHTAALCRNLSNRGHHVTLFAARGSDICDLEVIAPEMYNRSTSFADEHAVYRDLMESLPARNFDVLHNNSLHYLPVAMAATLPLPMVTTFHTPPFWELSGTLRLSQACSQQYVAVSDYIRRLWRPLAPQIDVVANGIDLRRFAFRAARSSEEYGIWFGRIVPEKGLHLAMDAARSIGLSLRFAGPVSDPHYYQSEILPRMSATTQSLGHLTHQALAEAIAGARVFLCTPLWDEPYGLVVAESLACGTPVAAFARGALPDLLNLSCGALAKPGDVASLAMAARRAQKVDRRACRIRALEVADEGRMMDAYERVYRCATAEFRRAAQWAAFTDEIVSIVPSSDALRALYARRLANTPFEQAPEALCPV